MYRMASAFNNRDLMLIQERRDRARQGVAELTRQLYMAINMDHSLDFDRNQKKMRVDMAQRELSDFQTDGYRLQESYRQKTSELQDRKASLAEKQSNLTSLNDQLSAVQRQMESITQRIRELDEIINRPEPPAIYERRCVNGHLNCPNLPSTYLRNVNEEAIEECRRAVAAATAEKERLNARFYELNSQSNSLNSQIYDLQNQIDSEQYNLSNCEMALAGLEYDIQSNQDACESKNNDIQWLMREAAEVDTSASAADAKVSDLWLALQNAQDEVRRAEIEFSSARSTSHMPGTLPSMAPSYPSREAMLEAIARQEMMQESAGSGSYAGAFYEPATAGSGEDGYSLTKLERIAMEELRAEQASMASVIGAAKDRISGAVDDIKGLGRRVREVGSDVLTTAGDLWPSGVGFAVTAMFDGPRGINAEFFGEKTGKTGDLLIDYANSAPR